ncbi:hypothetical protein [Actinomyces haliotis]|uniref:hypothetical protein n=1 Tax=Actinomyces haliotis TaxID=1280843 RepID=UPI00189046CE|nr:hypothetical protein [Actinomyces haliotis]
MHHLIILLIELAVCAVLAVALVRVMGRKPWLAMLLVLCSIAFVPVWVAPPVNPYVPPATLACVLALVVLLPRFSFRLTAGDVLVLAAMLLVMASRFVGANKLYVQSDVWLGALPAYLVGRCAIETVGRKRVYALIAGVWAVVAVLALVEFATRTNIFVNIRFHNSMYSTWSQIQIRSGLARVEGAFGHSIALGTSLAAGIPFAAAAPWKRSVRVGVMLLILAGTLPTLSRTGMLCAFVALALSVTLMRSDLGAVARGSVILLLGAGAALILPTILQVFAVAGTEQSGSADYRGHLLRLITRLIPLGQSPAAQSNGRSTTWDGFESVDDQMLLGALRFGWAPVVLLSIGLAVLIIRTLRTRATAPQIAVVSFIPAYVTVAFITQLGTVVWLVIGLAVATQAEHLLGGAGAGEGHRRPDPAAVRSADPAPVARVLTA